MANTVSGGIRRLATNLGKIPNALETGVGAQIGIDTTERLRRAVVEANSTAWGKGKQGNNADAIGNIYYRPTKTGVSIYWDSEYAKFLEYGTGVEGVKGLGSMPEIVRAYTDTVDDLPRDDVTRNTGSDEYWLVDPEKTSGEKVFSRGWAPFAPFYHSVIEDNKYKFKSRYEAHFNMIAGKTLRMGL
ncbi:MAG: hypothetical protein II001_00810 [Bacteroidales bacterium]|nr:hypothetical protein [Bacteroidales bacterium]